jgi:hypothetical protein
MIAAALVALANIAVASGSVLLDESFESPTLEDGAVGDPGSSWTRVALEGSGWHAFNPKDNYISGATYVSSEQPGYLPSPADGLQSAYAYSAPGSQAFIYQNVGNPSLNTVYTLTFAVGQTLSNPAAGWDVYLLDQNTMSNFYAHMSSGDANANLPTAGTFATNTISWTNTNVTDNGGLCVFLSVKGATGGAATQEILIDNVRLTAESVPEPSAIALASVGLFSLLAYAWRKHK